MARRTAARRRRRTRRLTPRRWLPFLALSALVAAATIVESDRTVLTPEQVDATLDVATLPAVARADAIGTAWYCAGGSAAGDDGIAELTVVLANDADVGAKAEVTAITEDGDEVVEAVDVPANGRARVRLADLVDGEWAASTVEVRGGRVAVEREVRGPLGLDSAPCSTEASDRWYVASGATERGAELYLSLFNPFPDATSVDISFATDSGPREPRALSGLSIPARSVRVVRVADDVTDRTAIATSVRVRSGRVVVDRIQTYDGTGEPLPDAGVAEGSPAPSGLVSTLASPVRADRWIVPGARLSPGVRTQVAVFNPTPDTAEIDLVVGYQEPERNPTVEPVELTLRGYQQTVVDLADVTGILPDVDLWVDVRSLDGVPLVVERRSFFADPASRTGAVVSLASPFAATRWLVAQGGNTQARTTTVQVANPGPADAVVTVVQIGGGVRADLPSAEVTVPAGDRRALVLDDASAAATLVLDATGPVVVTSSLSSIEGPGIGVSPAFAYPETVVAVPPFQ